MEDIKQSFLSKHEEEGREGIAYSLDDSFRSILEERMNYFSKSNEADAINRVRGELGQVRGIMIENIDKVMLHSCTCLLLNSDVSYIECAVQCKMHKNPCTGKLVVRALLPLRRSINHFKRFRAILTPCPSHISFLYVFSQVLFYSPFGARYQPL